jgi:predicted nucleic acid-binding protein
MPRVVVDASAMVAALLADGRVRHALLHTAASLHAPPFVKEEVAAHLSAIAARARLPPVLLEGILAHLLARIEVVPRVLFEVRREEAVQRVLDAEAVGDEDHVALALALEAPIWTFDKDFARIPGIRVISTAEVAAMQP